MSTIAVDNVKPSAGGTSVDLLAGLSKQSVNYNQGTPTINSSVNTSSVIDVSTGVFEPQFTNDFTGTFYIPSCIVETNGTSSADRVAQVIDVLNDKTTDGCQYMTTGNAGVIDYRTSSFIQGDLA